MIDLSSILAQKIDKLDKQIRQAATERDESATPMESASDQTRQIANQLFNSLLEEKRKLIEIKPLLRKYNLIYVVSQNAEQRSYMIVPEGMGGVQIGEILLIGDSSPIAVKILGKTSGEHFELNDRTYVLAAVRKNT